jgi:hypothetical protein
MDLLASSAERISVVSGKRAALSTVIIRPNGLSAFHEKAGMSQVCFSLFSLFLPVDSFRSSRAASVAILPSALLVERFSLGAWWAFPIQ